MPNLFADHLPESSVSNIFHQTRRRRTRSASAVAVLVVPMALHAAPTHAETVAAEYRLAALTQPTAATVLTLEAGLVGAQNLIHLTPLQLQGAYCAPPNTCVPVDYVALPGQAFNAAGADAVLQKVDTLPTSEPIILMGHSQGAQVIYSVLRRWQADPSAAPDPSQVSWVSIGNPDNRFGGFQTKSNLVQDPLPNDTPYSGIEVIRQYDGWADWPDDPMNLVAVLNAVAGMFLVHPDYTGVDVNDPANVRYIPALPDGSPGNVTYVWVPNPVLPLISGTGPLAPMLDEMLRPIVESAYHRPVALPAPGASTPAPTAVAALAAPSLPAPAASIHGDPELAEQTLVATDSVVSPLASSTRQAATLSITSQPPAPARPAARLARAAVAALAQPGPSADEPASPVGHRVPRSASTDRERTVTGTDVSDVRATDNTGAGKESE